MKTTPPIQVKDKRFNTGIFSDSLLKLLERRDRFIPVRLGTLVDHALRDERLSEDERCRLDHLFRMMRARFHFEFHEHLDEILEDYSPFDPDTDILFQETLSAQERDACRKRFSARVHELLIRSNYTQLTWEQLRDILALQTLARVSVSVDLEDFREVRIYYRGVDHSERNHERWKRWLPGWLRKRCCGPNTVYRFRRVVLFAQTHDDQILLRLFKNILLHDLKIVSPSPRIRMPLFDRLKMGSSFFGSLVTPLLKLLFAAAFNVVLFLMVLVGFIIAFIKVGFSFLSCKTKYIQTLSTNLYYQSLANNACVLSRLVDTAEEEEIKEILLAYYTLYLRRGADLTREELDHAVERWLHDEFKLNVDFEIHDAIHKLREKNLVEVLQTPDPETGQVIESFKVHDPKSSLRIMDKIWDSFFRFENETA